MWESIAQAKADIFMANGVRESRETNLADMANPMAGQARLPEHKTEEQIALERAENSSRRTQGL